MRHVRAHPRREFSVPWGCCLPEGAAGKEGLDGPTQCWVCLVDYARIVKDTDVQNLGVIVLNEVFSKV